MSSAGSGGESGVICSSSPCLKSALDSGCRGVTKTMAGAQEPEPPRPACQAVTSGGGNVTGSLSFMESSWLSTESSGLDLETVAGRAGNRPWVVGGGAHGCPNRRQARSVPMVVTPSEQRLEDWRHCRVTYHCAG